MRIVPLLLLLCIFLFAGWNLCSADGFYIPSAQAVESLPDIPRQRALLYYDHGIETLIVESSLEANEGDRFAWILPLPAPPTIISPIAPGVLSTLEFNTAPRIISHSDAKVFLPIAALIVSLLVTAMIVTLNPDVRKQCAIFLVVLGVIAFLAAISVGGPMLAGTSSRPPTAEALRHERIGNYEVAVLRSDNSQALADWLRENRFAPIPERAEEVVDRYAAEGWVFLAAQLLRAQSGLLTPHPLKVVFPSARPVYPMRLTALAGKETELLLFAGGSGRFTHPRLHVQFADRYQATPSPAPVAPAAPATPATSAPVPTLRWVHFGNSIWGHGDLAGLLGAEGWLTCLRARLLPSDMREDFYLQESTATAPHRDTFYSPRGANAHVITLVLWIFTLAFPVLGIVFRRHRRRGKIAVGILVVAACLTGIILRTTLPIKDNIHVFTPGIKTSRYGSELRRHARAIDPTTFSSLEAYHAVVGAHVRTKLTNPYTGLPVQIEHSPGNIGFRHTSKGEIELLWYDTECFPHYQTLWKPPDPGTSR